MRLRDANATGSIRPERDAAAFSGRREFVKVGRLAHHVRSKNRRRSTFHHARSCPSRLSITDHSRRTQRTRRDMTRRERARQGAQLRIASGSQRSAALQLLVVDPQLTHCVPHHRHSTTYRTVFGTDVSLYGSLLRGSLISTPQALPLLARYACGRSPCCIVMHVPPRYLPAQGGDPKGDPGGGRAPAATRGSPAR